MPSRAWSLGASGPGKSGQTGPCGEEAARSARDTVCRVPPPACCPPVGAQGLGSETALSEGGSLERTWGSSRLPGGGGAGACCPLSHSPTAVRELPQAGGGVGGGVVIPWVSRALGLSDLLQRQCYCPTLWPPIVLLPNLRLGHTHGWHAMTHMVTYPLKHAQNHQRQGDAPKTPTHRCRTAHTTPDAP